MKGQLNSILCIDDDPDILEIARMCFEMVGGFKITCCNSGAEGIARAKEIKPDLILVDMMMPEMDGIATLKEIHKHQDLNKTPVVFMTARIQPSEVKEYLALGAAGVVSKPFDPMKISIEIQSIWEKFDGE